MNVAATARPRWVTTRIARPTADLPRTVAFYRDLLGSTVTGGFSGHDGHRFRVAAVHGAN